jgi:hypothetical protein
MLRHDPFAPMARAEMEDRWQEAARTRLRRAAQAQRTPDELGPATAPHPADRLWRLIRPVQQCLIGAIIACAAACTMVRTIPRAIIVQARVHGRRDDTA